MPPANPEKTSVLAHLVSRTRGSKLFQNATRVHEGAKGMMGRKLANAPDLTGFVMGHESTTYREGPWSVTRDKIKFLGLTAFGADDTNAASYPGSYQVTDDTRFFAAQMETPESYQRRAAERDAGKKGLELSKAEYVPYNSDEVYGRIMGPGDLYASTTTPVKLGSVTSTVVLATLGGVKLRYVHPRQKKELDNCGRPVMSDPLVSVEFANLKVLSSTSPAEFTALARALPLRTRLLPLGHFGRRTQIFAVDGALNENDFVPGGKYGHLERPTEPELPGEGASAEELAAYEAAHDLYTEMLAKHEAARKEPYVVTLANVCENGGVPKTFDAADVVIKSLNASGESTGEPDVPGMTLEFFHLQNLPGSDAPCSSVLQCRLFQREMAKLGGCTPEQWTEVLRHYVYDIVTGMTGLARVLNPKTAYAGATPDLGCAPFSLTTMVDFAAVLRRIGFKVSAAFVRNIVFGGKASHTSVEMRSSDYKSNMQTAFQGGKIKNLLEEDMPSIEAAIPDGKSAYYYIVVYGGIGNLAKRFNADGTWTKRYSVLMSLSEDEYYDLFTSDADGNPNTVTKDGASFMVPNVDSKHFCVYAVQRSVYDSDTTPNAETLAQYTTAFGNVDLTDAEAYMTVAAVGQGEQSRVVHSEDDPDHMLDWSDPTRLPPLRAGDGSVDPATGRWVHKSMLMITDGKGTSATGAEHKAKEEKPPVPVVMVDDDDDGNDEAGAKPEASVAVGEKRKIGDVEEEPAGEGEGEGGDEPDAKAPRVAFARERRGTVVGSDDAPDAEAGDEDDDDLDFLED